jgi:predicted nucleic acid-binding protein
VALARQLQVKLVTTDEKILEQFPAVSVSPADFLKA